jgi:hypothetical protein
MLMRIGADATGAQRVVAGIANGANKAFSAIGKELTNRLVGAFAAGAVIDRVAGFFKDTVDYADNLGDLAENLGITIEEVQRLEVAANLAGVRFSKLQVLLGKITAMQAQAIEGDKKALGMFAALGLDPRNASALQIMEAAIGNQAVATELFGQKLNVVSNVMQKLKSLGPIELITQEQADMLGQVNDKLAEAERRMKVAAVPAMTGGMTAAAVALEIENRKSLATRLLSLVPGFGQAALIEGIASSVKAQFMKPSETGRQPSATAPPSLPPIQASPLALAAQSDALGRIGLFVGGRANVGEQMVTIGNYQLTELRRMRSILEEANR